jgi:bleomycin hydrolase
VKEIKATPVKNQGYSGTCWSFATCSMLESEMLRKGIEESDVSEMFIVRYAYVEKAILYVRLHGKYNFGEGGEAHDVINIMRKYGMVPQKAYEGKKEDETYYNHQQLESKLKEYLDTLINSHESKLPNDWMKGYEKILDKNMGNDPASFEYKGKKYTPKSFMTDYLGINPDDYIEFTSYTHHPFYSRFFLEIPDNWSFDMYTNIPVNELIQVIDSSLEKGYTIAWGGDVSENEFSNKKGIAIVPVKDWEHKSEKEKDRTLEVHEKEIKVTQEMRQKTFDNYTTTDDHCMHITGIAKDQSGNKYYITKNSWGKNGKKDGYVYLSEEFVRLKTIDILVNKNAVPVKILEENGIK